MRSDQLRDSMRARADQLGEDVRENARVIRTATSAFVPHSAAHLEQTPRDSICPSEDVFSYFMLTSPSESKLHGRFTIDTCMSYLLVFVTLLVQGVLLFCVYNHVIYKNMHWRNGIVNTGKSWDLMAPVGPGCNDGQSLCQVENGVYTCAPPSLQLIGRWTELDLNNDGVWSHAEVMEAREDLRCKHAVDPLEVFHVLITLLKEREAQKFIWLHPDVKAAKELPKTYFTYIMGDVAICGYRNEDMCGNLLQRGFFDVPLKTGAVPRVGSSVPSALDYCQDLLTHRGLCERILPSAYSTWKIEGVQECQDAEYDKFVYTDPSDNSTKSVLAVDYDAREDYEKAQTPMFLSYKTCIVFMWILLIVSMLREVGKGAAWSMQMKINESHERTLTEIDEDEMHIQQEEQSHHHHHHHPAIHSMSTQHRIFIFLVVFLRIAMLCVLLYVGLNFLGRQNDYIDLLLDGVALIFIVDIAEIIYRRVLRQDVRSSAEERDPIEIIKMGVRGLTSMPDVMDMMWFLAVVLMSIAFMWFYTSTVVQPLYNALQCTCLSQGDSCREAHTFSKAFWDDYWGNAVPSSLQAIKDLQSNFNAPAEDFKREFATNLLKFKSHHHRLG